MTVVTSAALYRACSALEESSQRLAWYDGLPEVVKGSALIMVLYIGFGLWMGAEAFGVTSLLGGTAR